MPDPDEELLLAVLNTTTVEADGRRDDLQGEDGLAWLRARGETGSAAERDSLAAARDLLQHAVRAQPDLAALARVVEGVVALPVVDGRGLAWVRHFPPDRGLAARVALAWAEIQRSHPGRLRACAEPQCARFLLDRSRANQARWCSMARCGNRAKARRHYQRARDNQALPG